jgi:hypothetical protein
MFFMQKGTHKNEHYELGIPKTYKRKLQRKP